MKIDDIMHIWVFVDDEGYVDTEFFYPEVEQNKIPYQMKKVINHAWDYCAEKPIRLAVKKAV